MITPMEIPAMVPEPSPALPTESWPTRAVGAREVGACDGSTVGHAIGGGVLVMLGSGDGGPTLGVGAALGAVELRKPRGPTSQARLVTKTRLGFTVGLLER